MKTDYLILHENEINWDELSADPNRSFSLAEIRMFRKHINWQKYLQCHNLSHDEMEIASKHFTEADYNFIALNNLADQEFIQNHVNSFDFYILLSESHLSQETLMKIFADCSVDSASVAVLEKNKLINLHDGTYDEFLLYANLKS